MKITVVPVLLLLILSGCTREVTNYTQSEPSQAASSIQHYAINVAEASAQACPAGGKSYEVYLDDNQSGALDSGERILSSQVVCNGKNGANGANGADGYTTLFSITRVTAPSCEAGAGIQVSSGVDLNRSSALDNSEIDQSQVLCDGKTGAVGEAGASGRDGKSLVFQVTAASGNICPAGGKIIVMASDENSNGVLDGADSHQQSLTLCNGVAGSNAEVPAYTPVAAIYPCGNTVTYKEVLLRLKNGQVLASFSDNVSGSMTRLTFLPDGSYMDTDNTSCTFTLATSGSTRSISWFGQVQQSWSLQ